MRVPLSIFPFANHWRMLHQQIPLTSLEQLVPGVVCLVTASLLAVLTLTAQGLHFGIVKQISHPNVLLLEGISQRSSDRCGGMQKDLS